MKLNHREIHCILISALRYVLGRMTYIVSDTADIIKEHLHEIPENTKTIMLRDIRHAIDSNNYGMKCDLQTWNELYEVISKSMVSLVENADRTVHKSK